MRHEYTGFEQIAFWLHVAIALFLLVSLLTGNNLHLNQWLKVCGQALTVEFPAASLLCEVTRQPAISSTDQAADQQGR
jgi:hypothetical protein